MRIIEQSAELVPPSGEYKKDIEIAARVAYKSEHLITEGSAEKMFDRLVNSGHTSCLEFGTIYLRIPVAEVYIADYSAYTWNRLHLSDGYWYITTNARHIQNCNLWSDVEKYGCAPTALHKRRITLKLTTSRTASHELVRHRTFSFCQESQRYCNYSKDKFDNEVTYIKPTWLKDLPTGHYEYRGIANEFLWSLKVAEQCYNGLIAQSWTPQQARTVLPNATKTEIYMCGYEDDWEKFLELRTSKNADPMMQDLAGKIKTIIERETT